MGPAREAATEPWWSPADGDGAAGSPAPADPDLPVARDGRPVRAPRPGALPPARAVTGALVSVAGVVLGIGTLLWATDAPAADPTVRSAGAVTPRTDVVLDEPAVPEPAPSTAPAATPSPAVPPPAPPAASPAPAAAPPALLVLNNSRVEGLAERAARTFEAGGWPVRETGNLRGRIRATTVYYEPGQERAARELARRFPAVERVLPRLDGLPGTGLTVVVTRDFAG